jgi:hypothetical protein
MFTISSGENQAVSLEKKPNNQAAIIKSTG